MNISRVWPLLIGLMVCLLLGGGAYFLYSARKFIPVVPNSPTVAVNSPILNPSSAGVSTAPTTVSTPQPQGNSVPAPFYEYTARGQLQRIVYPDGSTYTYAYDAYGDKIQETNRKGGTWSYLYDQNHHPISVIDPDGRASHTVASSTAPGAN